MLTLVIGGAASGKSEWAEHLVQTLPRKRYYLATMQPFGEEAEERIQKHRERRAQDGYETIECYTGLSQVQLKERGTVLLDCLGNLVANEMFAPDGAGEETLREIQAGVQNLQCQAKDIILVTNEVFSGGKDYAGETLEYLRTLGALNCSLAALADIVWEVVCGLPRIVKGRQDK